MKTKVGMSEALVETAKTAKKSGCKTVFVAKEHKPSRFCGTCGKFMLCSDRGRICPWMGAGTPGECEFWYPIKARKNAR